MKCNLKMPVIFSIMLLIADAALSQAATASLNTAALRRNTPPNAIQPLSIGDKVPEDLLIENIINFPTATSRISAFKGKLILIDFWGTTCSSCIAALPKIDSLQKIYKDKLQVLTVTNYDTKDKVINTLQRFKKTQNLSLPIVLNDVKLKKYFPHEMVSHVIWIDGTGTVKAITGTEYITSRNLQTVMEGKEVNWPVKNDVFDFDYEKPFLEYSSSNLVQPDFMYSSAFTGYMDGIDGTDKLLIDSNKNTVTRNHFNHTLLQFCDGSLNGSGTGLINPKHLILHVKYPGRYIKGDNEYYAEWAKKNTYCYSITLPLTLSKEETKEAIKTDLTHWLNVLGITIKKESRLVKCFVLIRTKKDDGLLSTKGGNYEYGLDEPDSIKRLINSNLSNLLWHLNQEIPGIPWVMDETGISKDFKIDMELKIGSFQNIPVLRKELQHYGLDLIEAARPLDMYVITERGFGK